MVSDANKMEAHRWSCSAGPQYSSMWSSSSRGQSSPGLRSWRLHKRRLADVRGPETRAAPWTAWPKHWVGLSWGRLEASIKKYAQKFKLRMDKIESVAECTLVVAHWKIGFFFSVPLYRSPFSDAAHQTSNDQHRQQEYTNHRRHDKHHQTLLCTHTNKHTHWWQYSLMAQGWARNRVRHSLRKTKCTVTSLLHLHRLTWGIPISQCSSEQSTIVWESMRNLFQVLNQSRSGTDADSHMWSMVIKRSSILRDLYNTFREFWLRHVAEWWRPARVAVTPTLMVTNLPETTLTVSYVIMAIQG